MLSALLILTTLFVSSCDGEDPTPIPVEVESITFSGGSSADFTLEEDGTKQLTVSISPSNADDKTITWSSSDINVATVINGLVKWKNR